GRGPLRDLERAGEGAARRNAAEDALFAGQVARTSEGLLVADREHLVGHAAIEHGGHEIRRPTLDFMGFPLFAAEQGGARRLAGDDLRLRAGEADSLTRAHQGPTRTP